MRTEINVGTYTLPRQVQSIKGSSERAQMMRLFATTAGESDATVLLRGPTGTGKDHLAKVIHDVGREEKEFVLVNCGGIPESLLESELFGYERGSFTGAHAQKQGLLEVAQDGTLFLSEVGNMPLTFQAKLLDVLDQKPFRRIGGLRNLKVQTRIIAATNLDLEQAVENGSFREDLYYRLNVLSFPVPALRERTEDIPEWVEHFAGIKTSEPEVSFSDEVMSGMMEYSWPGNIRELKSAVERAIVLSRGEGIKTEHVLPYLKGVRFGSGKPLEVIKVDEVPVGKIEVKKEKNLTVPYTDSEGRILSFKEVVSDMEREYIKQLLIECMGNAKRACRASGFCYRTIMTKIRNHKLKDYHYFQNRT